MTSFGSRVKKARLDCGLTQEQLGLEIGVSKPAVSAWEADRDFPKQQYLEPLRMQLGVDLDYLICNSIAKARQASKSLGVREASPGYAGGGEQWLTPREVNVITAWRAMPAERQEALLVMMRPQRELKDSKHPDKATR